MTKYRYKVLQEEIKHRCRELLLQDCESLEIEVLKGVVSSDHIHMHIEYPAKHSISEIMKQFKGRSSRLLQKEFPSLEKRLIKHQLLYRPICLKMIGNDKEGFISSLPPTSWG
ncbi:IS200/IS605 family transposase [Phaeodactylibacter sp.]|uniref:IS200/IS605 family transposase n=1 Tax=Phaeodactylibacter sp. TaxID=1940289 RepID=UPI0025F036F9|nr:IS200/IS605 family transposase [Phaeodactylibacter sp.]